MNKDMKDLQSVAEKLNAALPDGFSARAGNVGGQPPYVAVSVGGCVRGHVKFSAGGSLYVATWGGQNDKTAGSIEKAVAAMMEHVDDFTAQQDAGLDFSGIRKDDRDFIVPIIKQMLEVIGLPQDIGIKFRQTRKDCWGEATAMHKDGHYKVMFPTMRTCTIEEVLIILAHELAHIYQYHTGMLTNGNIWNGEYVSMTEIRRLTAKGGYFAKPWETDAENRGLPVFFEIIKRNNLQCGTAFLKACAANAKKRCWNDASKQILLELNDNYHRGLKPKSLTPRADDANVSAPSTEASTTTDASPTVRKETPMTDQTQSSLPTVANAVLEIVREHGALSAGEIKTAIKEKYPALDISLKGKPAGRVGNELARHKGAGRLLHEDGKYSLPTDAPTPKADAPKADAPVATEAETETRKVPTPQEMRDKVKLEHKKAAVAANTDTAVVKYLKQSIYLTRTIEEFLADKIIPLVHDGTATDPKVIESGGKIFIKFKDASGDTDTEVVCDFTDETARSVLESSMAGINKNMDNIVGGMSLVPKLEVALEQELEAVAADASADAETPEVAETETDDAETPEVAETETEADTAVDATETDDADAETPEAQTDASTSNDASMDKDELWRLYQSNTELFAGVIAEAQDAEADDAEARAEAIRLARAAQQAAKAQQKAANEAYAIATERLQALASQ